MRPGAGYVPIEMKAPLKGLYTDVPSTQLPSNYSPRMSNMDIRSNIVFKRSGYHEIIDETLDGDVLGLVDFQELDLTETLVALTTTRQYKLVEGTPDTWTDITATQQSHLIQAVDDSGPDWFKISGNQTGVFIVGAHFDVAESTGNNDTGYVVTAVSYDSGTDLTQITVADVPDPTADGIITGVYYGIDGVDNSAEEFEVGGDQTSIFTNGTKIVIEDSTDVDGEYLVSSSSHLASVTTIVVDDITGSTVDGNIQVIQEMTTTGTDFYDWVSATDDKYHRLYVTNGRDRIRYWNGTGRFVIWFPEYPDFVTCKTLEIYYSHLVLGNVVTGTEETKLVAWSDTSDFEEFEDNNSGVVMIPALSGEIKRLETLGDRLIIYSDNSIGSMMFIGYPVIFSAEVLLQGIRLVSGQSIVSIGSAHLYCSEDNIFFFDGTRGIRAVGDNIRDLYHQELDLEYASRLFTFNDTARGLIYIIVPKNSSVSTTFVLNYDIFDLRNFIWTQITLDDRPQSLGFYVRRSSPSWVDPPDVAWRDDYGIWDDEGERVNFPVKVMGSGSEVFMWDETAGTDDGADMTATYETPDFVVPEMDQSVLGRWGELEIEAAGVNVTVEYSTDQGAIWSDVYLPDTRAGILALTGTFTTYRMGFDTVSRTVRFRFSGTDYFALRWLRTWVRPSGPR